MKKHLLARVLALFTALAMLSTTAFAASFEDLQNAINGNGGVAISGTDRYGYGNDISEASDGSKFEIEKDSSTIILNEDVVRADSEQNKSIVITDKVTIDLNGNNIDGAEAESTSALIQVKGEAADLTLKDSTASTDAETGEYVSGAVTGGNHVKVPGGAAAFGGGVSVTGGGSFTLESGAIRDNNANQNGGGIYVENGTAVMNGGVIDGNTAGHGGGGVSLNSTAASMLNGTATFTMNGGTISNNTASGYSGTNGSVNGAGGAISADRLAEYNVPDSAEIIINGGTITGNHADVNGGGISASNVNVTVNGTNGSVEISNNTAGSDGGGIFVNGSAANVSNAVIFGNSANRGGGIHVQNKSDLSATDSKIYNNTAEDHSDDIYLSNSTLKLPAAGSMNVTGADGKPITGWYFDGTDRYGNGQYAYVAQNQATRENGYTGSLSLKAAHDQYFKVTDDSGNELADVEKGTVLDLSTIETPILEGWEFTGWVLDDEIVETVTVTEETILTSLWRHVAHTTETTVENVVDAQIGVEGSYDEVTYCTVCHEELSRVTMTIPALEQPTDPTEPENPGDVTIPEPDVPMAGAPDAGDALSIEDEEVPLAGIVTLAQLLEELRQHEEIPETELPEDFKWIDHEYAQAIYWALAEELVVDTEEEPLDPDEILTVGLTQAVLDNFVAYYKELEGFAVTVEGEADEMVMDLGERLTAFYADLAQYEAEADAE